jgi:hypothetical protein
MDKLNVVQRVRERVEMGLLPPALPPLAAQPGGLTSLTGHIDGHTAIKIARCAVCDEMYAHFACRYPDGRVFRFHGRCHRIWEEECQRVAKQARGAA